MLYSMLYYVITAGNQNNLRSAAYEALMELIKNSPRDCYEHVKNTTVIILERLRAILQMEVSENYTWSPEKLNCLLFDNPQMLKVQKKTTLPKHMYQFFSAPTPSGFSLHSVIFVPGLFGGFIVTNQVS